MQRVITLWISICSSFICPLNAQVYQPLNFIGNDPFQTNYFIENKGQFDEFSAKARPIKFAIDHAGDHVYFYPGGFLWQIAAVKDEENDRMSSVEKEHITIERSNIELDWLGSNKMADIIGEQRSQHYFTYGEARYTSYGCKKLTYKNIYPEMDIEYNIPAEGGIHYSIVLNPGANIHDPKMKFKGAVIRLNQTQNKILIHHDATRLEEFGLKAFYENGVPIACRYRLSYGIIGFDFLEPVDHSKKIIIDPWIKQINSLNASGSAANKGYDVDFDYQGNLYVYGGGGFGENTKVAQYSNTGSLIWTFSGSIVSPSWQSQGQAGHIGNFGVEKLNGKTYIGQGLNNTNGISIIRLNINGIYDNFISVSNSNFTEMWEMNFDCNTGNILGMGGGTGSNINMGVINTNGNFNSSNIAGPTTPSQDILSSTITSTGETYVAMVSSSGTPSLDNTLIKVNANLNGNIWIVPSGFNSFSEASNKLYGIGTSISNGFNALHANSNYLYYYDGKHVKAFNKNNGSPVGSGDSINGHISKNQGGIYVDECDHIYLGGNNGNIHVYQFNGTVFTQLQDIVITGMNGRHIYDIKYNGGNGLLYVSGEGLVATIKRSQVCFDTTTSMNAVLDVNCQDATLSITNGDTSSVYSYIWTNNTSNTIVQSKLNTKQFADTLQTLVSGNLYTVVVVKDSLCGGVSEAFSFTVAGNQPVATNYTLCDGESITVNGHVYNTTGTYTDTMFTTQGCDSIVITKLTVSKNSTFTQIISICDGETVVVNGHVYTLPGTYHDTLMNSTGCDSIIHTTLDVTFLAASAQQIKICYGRSITVNQHTYSNSGVYIDTFYAITGCDSIVKTTLEVGASSDGDFFIPNVFTPNNDGLNDCFSVMNKQDMRDIECRIYNRWGELVFTTNQTWDCWNGHYKGVDADQGVYYYYIKITTSCGEVEYKGDITLLR